MYSKKEIQAIINDTEEIVLDELACRHIEDIPNKHKDLFNKFIYNEELVNKEDLENIINQMNLDWFKNVNKIYLLTEKAMESYNVELEQSDLEGLLFDNKVAINTLLTGDVIVNLNSHVVSPIYWERNIEEVIKSILHEVRHLAQGEETDPYYPYVIEYERRRFHFLDPNEDINLNEMEEDAENFSLKAFEVLKERLKEFPSEMINWNKVEEESYEE